MRNEGYPVHSDGVGGIIEFAGFFFRQKPVRRAMMSPSDSDNAQNLGSDAYLLSLSLTGCISPRSRSLLSPAFAAHLPLQYASP